MKKSHHKIPTHITLSRILFLIYLGAIAFLCFATLGSKVDMLQKVCGIEMDKIVHFIMFLPFPLLAWMCFEHTSRKPWKKAAAVLSIMLLGLAFAGGTEIVQGWLPNRFKDVRDFYADAAAIVLTSLFILTIDLRKK